MKKNLLYILLFFTGLMVLHGLVKPAGDGAWPSSGAGKKDEAFDTGETGAYDEERKTDQPDKFLQFHRGIRTRDGEPAPDYPTGYRWRELNEARTNEFARRRNAMGRSKSNGVTEWKERGPGNVPGRTRALFNIPGDAGNSTWLAGAATGGIWRTTNGGTSWSERSTTFPALPISSFAANASASVIYAGTGEYISSVYSAIGNGIFKSTDMGMTWAQLPATNNHPDFSIVTRLIVNPANPDVIIATTVPHNMSKDATSAIMRSANGGLSWTKVKEIEGFFEQIIASPANFNIQYASQNSVGVWKSTDAGLTWNLANKGMTPNGRVEIAISPVNPNRIFASAEGTLSGTEADLYCSSDAGATWSLTDVVFNGTKVDFFEGQGFYDNTIMADPFNENIVYFGGVSLFRATLSGTSSAPIDNYQIEEVNTKPFMFLHSFTGTAFNNEKLTVGNATELDVEVRFGPGLTQKAHRFTVPVNKNTGIAPGEYTYNNYVNVPFQVWDVSANPDRQLMASFRDQNRNGNFDLLPQYLTGDGPDYLVNSREYIFIHDITYNATSASVAVDQPGGQAVSMIYNFFPALAAGATWNPGSLPVSKLAISHYNITRLNATTVTAADGRGDFDDKNKANQVNLTQGVHADHHYMLPLVMSQSAQTFKILLANDGGVFVSKVSTTPGVTEGDWEFRGFGYNTSQFYGADKKPGAEEYIGGMQDNGTRLSPAGQPATALSNYIYGLGGDGFEVLWNSKDPTKILGSVYNGNISRSVNGGTTWQNAVTGLTPGSEFSFVTKLAHAKEFPDRVFTVGKQGVYVSENFGGSWSLTPISNKFASTNPFFLDVEVSRANANVVWAGGGMFNTGTQRNIHVSTDGGKTFTATNNFTQVPMGNITRLASHPVEENTAYALFSFAHAPKILRTTDRGQSWHDISGFGAGTSSTNGFPDVAVFCLYVRSDNPSILWAGTEIGIVESLDNGQTWALIGDFPNVSVWDMKGQDDQIVIATHGRGIWTAQVDAPQATIQAPEIIASGTSPLQVLMLRIESQTQFDSVQVFIGNNVVKRLKPVPSGIQDIALNNIGAGAKEIKLVAFKGNAPYQSMLHRMNNFDLLPAKHSYATYMNSIADLSVDGLVLAGFPGSTNLQRQVLQTDHNYGVNKTYTVIVRTPVTVSATLPMLYYSDIAIVEPANDAVVVEATKNGLDWIALAPAYDASYSGDVDRHWQTAFSNNQAGTSNMFLKHEVNFGSLFAPGDLLLFRLRMRSGPAITAWGWAINYISIQEVPLDLEALASPSALSLYPNPTTGFFTMDYSLQKTSAVSFKITDASGRVIAEKHLGTRDAGVYSEKIQLQQHQAGTYVVILRTAEGVRTGRIVIGNQ